MDLPGFYQRTKKKIVEDVGQKAKTLSSLGATAKRYASEYFKPAADTVRTRDFAREVVTTGVPTAARALFGGVESFVKDAGKTFGTGIAYANPGGLLGDYKRSDVNLDDLPTPKRMLANTGRAMLETYTMGKGPKFATSPKVLPRVAYGAGTGYGFDVLGRVAEKNGEIDQDTFKPGMATVAGGLISGIARPAAQMAQEGVGQMKRAAETGKKILSQVPTAVKNSVDNRLKPAPIELIPEHWVKDGSATLRSTASGKPDVIPPLPNGRRYTGPVKQVGMDPVTQSQRLAIGTERLIPEQRVARTKSPTVSDLFGQVRQALPRPGMSIVAAKPDANGKYPVGSFSARFDKKPRVEISDLRATLKDTNYFDIEDARKKVSNEISPLTTKWWKETATPQELARLDELSAEANRLDAILSERKKNGTMVGDLFSHDELFSRYPELRKIKIAPSYVDWLQGKGSFDPASNTITISEQVLRNDPKTAKSIILHELQHAIQKKEGFARGGSPKQFKDKKVPAKLKDLVFKRDMLNISLSKKLEQNGFPVGDGKYLGIDSPEKMAVLERLAKKDPDVARGLDNYKKASALLEKYPSAYQQYQRLGGELEARAVQRRMSMNPAERLSSDPYAAEAKATGIKSVDDVITRFDDGISSSVDEIIDAEADMMRSIQSETGGVSLIDSAPFDTTPGAPAKLRVSSNPKWYRDFYAANGRKPTKQEIRELAKARLESGSGYLSDDYQAALKESKVPTNKNTQAINEVNARKNTDAVAAVERMRQETARKASAVDDFVKSLDEIPTPWEKPGQVKPATPAPQYNQYQEQAFKAKQGRIKALKEVVEGPRTLRAMGYTKREMERLGVDEAKQIAELGKLGYVKQDIATMDFDRRRLILKHKVQAETLRQYDKRKAELNTNFLEGVDPKTLKDISPLQAGTRDVYRNFEDVFGENYPKLKTELLDQFDAAKGEFIREQQAWLKELDDKIVNGLGIKKGSKESAAIQRYGDTDLPDGERMTYDDLVKAFGQEKADKIVQADGWFRNVYDKMIDELNRVREYYFPTHPLYPETTKIIPKRENYYRHFQELGDGFRGLMNAFDTPANIDPALAVSSQYTEPKSKWLSFAQKREGNETTIDAVGGFLDYLKAAMYAKHIDPHIQRFRGVDQELASAARKGGDFMDTTRIGLAEELSKRVDPIEMIAGSTSPAEIKGLLMDRGLRERDAVRMAKDLVDVSDYQAAREYLKTNLSQEGFGRFSPEALGEQSQNKLNNFLKFLDNFANDLAGKTNPLDRPVQDNFFGRPVFRAINWLNSRVKANVILGNASSAVAQFFGIPNGIANAGVRNALPAVGDSLLGIMKNDTPAAQSVFLNERYFNGYDKFDPGIINNAKRFAVWLTSIGDKIGTTFTWNAQYRKALAEGVADPVKYADDWTRKMVAGRGIGEVPIMQKSKLLQVLAPFQLEVANQWRVFGDWARNDPSKLVLAKKLVEYSVAAYVMNRVAKDLRGSDVSFDPINAMMDALESYQEEEDRLKGAGIAAGRIAGEVFSNIPGGQVIAGMYPEYGKKDVMGSGIDLPTREDFFGDKDPTRFGGGLLASRALTDPLFMTLPPFGGRQIKNTIDGAKTLLQGYAESASGKVMTPVENTLNNILKGLLMGKGGIEEVQDYYETDQQPLSEGQSEKFMIGGKPYFDQVMASRAADQEKQSLAAPRTNVAQASGGPTPAGVYQLKDGNYYVPGLASDQKTFKTRELADFALKKEAFEASEENYLDLGDGRILRKDASGKAYPQRKDVFTDRLLSARMVNAKKNSNYAEWEKQANQRFELLTKLIEDPTVDDLERVEYQNAIDTLVADFAKYKEYGGAFTKPKVGRKLEEKYRYPLVDTDFLKIESMLSKGGRSSKATRARRPLALRRRQPPKVSRRPRA